MLPDFSRVWAINPYEEPFKKPEGIHWVLVNGVIAVESGEVVESGAGNIGVPPQIRVYSGGSLNNTL